MIIATYSPSDIQLECGGFIVQGFTSIVVSKNTESFRVVNGIRGKNTRVRNKDSSCTITVNVLSTSYTNDVFSEIVRQDRLYGRARMNVSFKDSSGSSLFGSENAYIKDYAAANYTEQITDRTWTIVCLSTYDYIVGGNNKSPLSVFDNIVGGASNYIQNAL